MATPLADRMAKHTPGQVTWPEPLLGKTWAQCRHFAAGGFKTNPDKGRCRLVAAHQNVTGMGFAGSTAIACPKFTERDD
jgi:hypothetical protein